MWRTLTLVLAIIALSKEREIIVKKIGYEILEISDGTGNEFLIETHENVNTSMTWRSSVKKNENNNEVDDILKFYTGKIPDNVHLEVNSINDIGTRQPKIYTHGNPSYLNNVKTINHYRPKIKTEKDQTTKKVVAGYFTEWSVYARNFTIKDIKVEKLTHLMYAFLAICGGEKINDALEESRKDALKNLKDTCLNHNTADFEVTIHDYWAATEKLLKGQNEYDNLKGNFKHLIDVKKTHKDLKIFASIGGWTLSDPFFQFGDDKKRKVFINSVKKLLLKWEFFDGIDIDWEFPGGKGANKILGSENDNLTYTLLMKELRYMLNEVENIKGKKYGLTTAVSAGWDKIQVVNYTEVQKYVDYIFLMTYDFKGSWSLTDIGNHAALYPPKRNPNEKYTTEYALKELKKQKVSSEKVVIGVAMYGRGWTGFNGKTASGAVKGRWEEGSVDYKTLKKYEESGEWTLRYDSYAEAAYMLANATGDFISYDNPESVRAKAKFVEDENLGGLFAWSLDADTENAELLSMMNDSLKK